MTRRSAKRMQSMAKMTTIRVSSSSIFARKALLRLASIITIPEPSPLVNVTSFISSKILQHTFYPLYFFTNSSWHVSCKLTMMDLLCIHIISSATFTFVFFSLPTLETYCRSIPIQLAERLAPPRSRVGFALAPRSRSSLVPARPAASQLRLSI